MHRGPLYYDPVLPIDSHEKGAMQQFRATREQEWAYSAALADLFGMKPATFIRRVRAWQAKYKIPSHGVRRGLHGPGEVERRRTGRLS